MIISNILLNVVNCILRSEQSDWNEVDVNWVSLLQVMAEFPVRV